MPSPFPGMDPYLENPIGWRHIHSSYILGLQRALNAVLPEGFAAQTDQRVYVNIPTRQIGPDVSVFATARRPVPLVAGTVLLAERIDVETPEEAAVEQEREYFINVLDFRGGETQLVASVEVLSPTNKTPVGYGLREYQKKQKEVIEAGVHLLEIDLLRAGHYVLAPPEQTVRENGPWDYLVALTNASVPDRRFFWRVSVQRSLPAILVPLTEDVAPVRLDLQEVWGRCYDESRFRFGIDYGSEPFPPLSPDSALWADTLLREKGLR